jgi:MFS transporter, AAHS family, 3-hydroxyphenylpropionic acid transporter
MGTFLISSRNNKDSRPNPPPAAAGYPWAGPTQVGTTLALCFCVSIIEGLDLQSMGIAAPKLGPEFALSRELLGVVLMASPLGLFFGSFLGGRLADFWGRKRALLAAVVVFGVFQLGTVWAPSSLTLIAIRFLCGLGLGGAMPNLVALTSEVAGGRNSILYVVTTIAGMPTGGAVASLIAFMAGGAADWRLIFYIGGIGPLVLTPLLAILLPESRLFREARAAAALEGRTRAILETLFGPARLAATLLLWAGLFGTTLITYLLLNWLPVLMVAKGFSKSDAFLIQLLFNIGAAAGSIFLGWLMQLRRSRLLLLACYVGIACGLLALALHAIGLLAVLVAVTATGGFLLGAQFILYGITPDYYNVETRGTGIGAAVASSRLGSAAGPLLAGQWLGAGASAAHVLQGTLPVVAISATAAMILLFLKRRR